MPLQQVLKWTSGSIVELESTVNDPVEVVVNNCVIARAKWWWWTALRSAVQQIVSRADGCRDHGPVKEAVMTPNWLPVIHPNRNSRRAGARGSCLLYAFSCT